MHDLRSSQGEETQQMSLRERKKRLALAAIEETALRLFQQRGYEQTSIQDIADAVMMSSRTFFRYFTSKEDVLLASTQAALREGIRYLERIAPTESARAALTATFMYLASLYQQQRAGFLLRYQVAKETATLASMYIYSLGATEPAICDALGSRLKTALKREDMRLLVAVYMATFRVTLEIWLEQEATGDLSALLRERLERLSSLNETPEGR